LPFVQALQFVRVHPNLLLLFLLLWSPSELVVAPIRKQPHGKWVSFFAWLKGRLQNFLWFKCCLGTNWSQREANL
jgi:hypothetical protein